ncbi:histidine kinase [Actinoplanes sp. SE50]|uniref:sensor histidine kinase n=1 Tax=unclassified Actinoplanes TaxID=2626549 RepID=UPI00023ED3DA|nr:MULTISPECIES: histidine kinase [unclassified Actinoplanes]AEV82813.1 two-component system sensor kinase [Actinoplanes sp. SE50/110]ATO81209.1 histidine kinase [Actinoplanes sp. SE50]SLL98616.1 two-component system sensor kinase [Actinoplanes sp. SE50/110]
MGPLVRLAVGRETARPPVRGRLRFTLPLILFVLVSLGLAAWEELSTTREIPALLVGIIAVGSVLPVAVSYRWPVNAWRLTFLMIFLGWVDHAPGDPWPWNAVQILATLFVLGRLAAVSASPVTLGATTLTVIAVLLLGGANSGGAAVLIVAITALGNIASHRRRTRELLAEQTELNEQERAKRAVLEERTRIAREMHDVVAHHMSMIAVQAETAPYRLPALPDEARDELASIAGAAREALADMRRLLGVLRAEHQEADRAPQPGYAEIAALVITARRAGLPVTGELGEVAGVGEAAGLAAYRIAQEALANAARHAPGGPVRLTARAAGDDLELSVTNELTTPPEPGHRPGHGLIGMRERVALLGGELSAGPDGAGAYRVLARIPRQPETR